MNFSVGIKPTSLAMVYCTISFNSAGPVTRDGPAEILVSALAQTCRDMHKIFGRLAPQATKFFLFLVYDPWRVRHPTKITVTSVTFRRFGLRDA
jgi:hypothetical protein